jgi:EAL domain-containing protein (putative c-di-GMP-specific phosphodiesterase class I)
VKSVIDLGHNFGMNVVAEGIEDQLALDTLKQLGCDFAQGYFISVPLPAEEFFSWIGNTDE